MIPVLDHDEYLQKMLGQPRPGAEKILAFYDNGVGAICRDPKLMLLPMDDHIVHRGDGVFESFKFESRRIYQFVPHMERLERSAKAIFLEPPCSWEEVGLRVLDLARATGKSEGAIRLILGRGPGGFGIDPDESPRPSLYLAAYELHHVPEEKYVSGVSACKSSIPAKQSYMAKIKSLNYLPNMLIKREAKSRGCDFSLCFDENGFLAEGAIENACIVDQAGTLVVPEFTNALRGTTLLRCLDLIQGEVPVHIRKVSEDEVKNAKELMVVGTTLDVLSIVRFEGKPVHDAKPGPVATRMRELLRQDLLVNGTPIDY